MLPETFAQFVAERTQTKVWAMGERESPTTGAELEAWEISHGVTLPLEYRQIVGTWGAGDIGLVSLFSVRPGSRSIDAHLALAKGLLPKEFIPISDNGCGDYYGFSVSSGQCGARIYFADHEAGFTPALTQFVDVYEYIARHGF